MLLGLHLRYKPPSNSSALAGVERSNLSCDGTEPAFYAWDVVSALCFVFGFPSTVAILWEMFKIHRRKNPFSPNELFILNLSTMDVIFFVFLPPGILNNFIWLGWDFMSVWCGVYALNMCGRPLLMACTCLDCYLAVVHPVVYHKRKGLAPRVVMAGIVWTLTIASAIAYSLSSNLFNSMLPVVTYLIAVIIIVICDGFIFYTLIKSDFGRNSINPQKKRAIQTIIFSLTMVIISYLPPVVLISVEGYLITKLSIRQCILDYLVTLSSSWGSAVMPLLYLYNIGKFDFLRLGRCKF